MEPTGLSRTNAVIRWFRELNPWVIDAVLGTAFVIIGLGSLYADDVKNQFEAPDALGVALVVITMGSLYVRRYSPLTAHLVACGGLVALAAFNYPTDAESQIVLLTTYALGAYACARDRTIGLAGLVAGLIVVAIIGLPDADASDILFSGGFYFASYFFGSTMRNRRLYAEEMEARAQLLERERDEDAKRAVANERLRIAQELHDVVAHSMGVIAVQAGVGAHVIDTDPAEAKKSLEAISQTSRSTLTEIRRLLGVLRSDEGADYAPAPGLANLDRLVRDVGNAGVEVDVAVDGTACELPPGVDFTAYRIVQEALTNVLKHAGPARAEVHIGYEPEQLTLMILDNGRGVNGRAPEGGHGLMGMRERVAVYGGAFQAGPRPGGGFAVTVTLPYGEPE